MVGEAGTTLVGSIVGGRASVAAVAEEALLVGAVVFDVAAVGASLLVKQLSVQQLPPSLVLLTDVKGTIPMFG